MAVQKTAKGKQVRASHFRGDSWFQLAPGLRHPPQRLSPAPAVCLEPVAGVGCG